jgi:hypothetical protein
MRDRKSTCICIMHLPALECMTHLAARFLHGGPCNTTTTTTTNRPGEVMEPHHGFDEG